MSMRSVVNDDGVVDAQDVKRLMKRTLAHGVPRRNKHKNAALKP